MKRLKNVRRLRHAILLAVLFLAAASAQAFNDFPLRDSAVARQYALWAQGMIESGDWQRALAGLERAADFADVSSDISYMLAQARAHTGGSRRLVLEALDTALHLNRWDMFDSEAARLLRSRTLIEMGAHHEALTELSRVRPSPQEAVLNLRALAASRPQDFFARAEQVFDMYPRETEPVRVFFDFLHARQRAGHMPSAQEMRLLELVIRRLPVLLDDDPALAWMAAPFIWDRTEATRLILAYRALNPPSQQSLPASLRLLAIDEETAVNELFAFSTIERTILDDMRFLMLDLDAILLFERNLSEFNGVITEDANGDGIPETFAEYIDGMLVRLVFDADQDNESDITVYFEGGLPVRALARLPPEGGVAPTAVIRWERHPAILDVVLNGVTYIPRPFAFFHSPFVFSNVWGSGLLFPERDPLVPSLNRRALVSNSLHLQRPSLEFHGGVEVIELDSGIPVRAQEFVGGRVVADMEFFRGLPQFQRVDLTLSGRMDTVRRFSAPLVTVELEDMWHYNREVEYTFYGVQWLHD